MCLASEIKCIFLPIIWLCSFLQTTLGYCQNSLQGGIQFQSYETSKDNRTGLEITYENELTDIEILEIKFQLQYWNTQQGFGHILRLIGNKDINIDLVSSAYSGDSTNNILVVIGEHSTSLSFSEDELNTSFQKWMSVNLTLDYRRDSILLSINNQVKGDRLDHEQSDFQLVFGKSNIQGIRTSDVPPIMVKDINVSVNGNDLWYWPLDKHRDGFSFDNLKNNPLYAQNPIWMVNRHVEWQKLDSIYIPTRPQITYDQDENKIYLLSFNQLTIYNLTSKQVSSQKITNVVNLPHAQQSLYYPDQHQIWTFDFDNFLINKFDVQQARWVDSPANFKAEPAHWHLNKLKNSDSAFFFGGYGFHEYKDEFRIFSDGEWETHQLNEISPRYLSAAGFNGKGDIILFGGYGSRSGYQEQSPRSYYECYLVDTGTLTDSLLWSFPNKEVDHVYSNSLLTGESDSSFLVLSFPKDRYKTYAILEEYNLYTGNRTVFDDSIEFRFHDTESYADLIKDEKNNRIIAVLLEKSQSGFVTRIFSIQQPPILTATITQLPLKESFWWLWLVIPFMIGGGVTFIILKKRKQVTSPEGDVLEAEESFAVSNEIEKLSAILLMGGFQVIDKNGIDISHKFSTTLKLLFNLILLHSVNDQPGASSQTIWEEIWGDKPQNKARNNRNVNIKKLREILSQVGDITIVGEGSRWKIEIGNDVFCDYKYILETLAQDNQREVPRSIIPLAKKGNILPGMELEWLDNFKSDLSNKLIDKLLLYYNQHSLSNEIKIQLADAIFKFDMISRDALFIKCKALAASGKYALAKKTYGSFTKEYELMYNEPFDTSFEDVIHEVQR